MVTVSSTQLPSTFSHVVHVLSRSPARSHPPHVSRLSAWVSPYLPGYGFPLPFGGQPSLLEASCAHWGLRPSLRLAYCLSADPIGVATFHTREMPPGWVPPLPRGIGVHEVDLSARLPLLPASPFQPVTVTRCHAASSEVHLRSPVRCSPGPVASFGSMLPWTLPLAFHPTVTSDAERDWRQPWTLG